MSDIWKRAKHVVCVVVEATVWGALQYKRLCDPRLRRVGQRLSQLREKFCRIQHAARAETRAISKSAPQQRTEEKRNEEDRYQRSRRIASRQLRRWSRLVYHSLCAYLSWTTSSSGTRHREEDSMSKVEGSFFFSSKYLRGPAKYGSRGVEVKGFHWLVTRRGHHSCHPISVHAKRAHFSA